MSEDQEKKASVEEAKRVLVVDGEQWERLQAALEAEPRVVPALVELFGNQDL